MRDIGPYTIALLLVVIMLMWFAFELGYRLAQHKNMDKTLRLAALLYHLDHQIWIGESTLQMTLQLTDEQLKEFRDEEDLEIRQEVEFYKRVRWLLKNDKTLTPNKVSKILGIILEDCMDRRDLFPAEYSHFDLSQDSRIGKILRNLNFGYEMGTFRNDISKVIQYKPNS